MHAANALQYNLGWVVQIYNAAEALPNLINPFWMLPILGILGLKARDLIGFTVVQFAINLPLVLLLLWVLGATLILFASYTFRPDPFSYIFRSEVAKIGLSLEPARIFFTTLQNAGLTIAAVGALGLYLAIRRARYFGNTAPLIVAVLLLILVTTGVETETWLWALPFLLAFVGGVFADLLETRYRRWFLWITGGLLLAQAALSIASLSLLTH